MNILNLSCQNRHRNILLTVWMRILPALFLICISSSLFAQDGEKYKNPRFCNLEYWLDREFPKDGQTIGGYKAKRGQSIYSMEKKDKPPTYKLLEPSEIDDTWAKDSLNGAIEDWLELDGMIAKLNRGEVKKEDLRQHLETIEELKLIDSHFGKIFRKALNTLSKEKGSVSSNKEGEATTKAFSDLDDKEKTKLMLKHLTLEDKENSSENSRKRALGKLLEISKALMSDSHNRSFRVFKLGDTIYGGLPVGRSTPGRIEKFLTLLGVDKDKAKESIVR